MVFHVIDGRIYISGMPRADRKRAWLLNLEADPRFTFHLKGAVQADLPAIARVIDAEPERRAVFGEIVEDLERAGRRGHDPPQPVDRGHRRPTAGLTGVAMPDGSAGGRLAAPCPTPATSRPRRRPPEPAAVAQVRPARRTITTSAGRARRRAHRGVPDDDGTASPPAEGGDAHPPPVELDTRPDWLAAFATRGLGWPATADRRRCCSSSCADGAPAPSIDPLARAVADAIRAEARETDRAVRYGAHSFRMLLPETGDRAARAVADRLGSDIRGDRRGAHARRDTVDRRGQPRPQRLARGRARRGRTPAERSNGRRIGLTVRLARGAEAERRGRAATRRAWRPGGRARPPGRRTTRCGRPTAG